MKTAIVLYSKHHGNTKKHCREIGKYHCYGFDTFGPFGRIGGIAKGHPTEKEIAEAVRFYKDL